MRFAAFSILPLAAIFLVHGEEAGYYDIQELRSLSYDTSIADDFLWFADGIDVNKATTENIDELEEKLLEKLPDENDENFVFPTSRSGQKFVCVMPNVDISKIENEQKSSKNPKYYSDALAASFYVNKCIRSNNGWWSYQLCRGQMIHQTHGEPKSEGYVKNILGIFDGNFSMPEFQISTADRPLHVAESYSSGTFCDLEENKNPRKTTVKYVCDAMLGTEEAYIYSVEEIRPCEYELLVKVGSLCKYSEFLPPNKVNAHQIRCYPYLEKSQIRQFLEAQVAKKIKFANDKKQRRNAMKYYRKEYEKINRRYVALMKTAVTYNFEDSDIVANTLMDLKAATFNFLVAGMTDAEGKQPSKSANNTMWTVADLPNTANFFLFAEYDTLADEDRGNLWHYMHDKSWPRNHFPKSVYYTTVANGHYSRILEWWNVDGYLSLSGYNLRNSILNLRKYGIYNIENVQMPMDEALVEEWFTLLTENHVYWWKRALGDEQDTFFNEVTFSMMDAFQDVVLDNLFSQIASNMHTPSEMTDQALVGVYKAFLRSLERPEQKVEWPESFTAGAYDANPMDLFKFLADSMRNQKNKKISLLDDAKRREKTEEHFRFFLAPFYCALSWRYIRRDLTLFEAHPPYHRTYSKFGIFYDFHRLLVMDYVNFSRMLSTAFLWKIQKEFEILHNPKLQAAEETKQTTRYWHFQKLWPSLKEKYYGGRFSDEEYATSISEIIASFGMDELDMAKLNVFNARAVMDVQDAEKLFLEKRKEAVEMSDLIESAIDNGLSLGPKERARVIDEFVDSLDEKMKKTVKRTKVKKSESKKAKSDDQADVLSDMLIDSLVGEKKSKKGGKSPAEAEDAIELIDMLLEGEFEGDVAEKLEKVMEAMSEAGIDPNSVSLKLVEVDAKDLTEETLSMAAKQLESDIFGRFDAKKKFSDIENAYGKKYDMAGGESERGEETQRKREL